MAGTGDYRKIKKVYGEEFAKLCRELFPQILNEGKLYEILNENFSHNCYSLKEDLINNNMVHEFKEFIFQQFKLEKEAEETDERNITEIKTPYQILEERGYDLYECTKDSYKDKANKKNNDMSDIQTYNKYYSQERNEVLCTIKYGKRLENCYCFFAIKKDAEKLKREDFKKPKKDDDYSISVLGIQFDKVTGTVEIISRYNHSVRYPNCTLDNNLNNLAPGLRESFANLMRERGLNLSTGNIMEFQLPGYTKASDGEYFKYYKYNMERNRKYYCPGNILIANGIAKKIGKLEEGLLVDYFYISQKDKKIQTMDLWINDSFVEDLQDIEKIEIKKIKSDEIEKIIKIYKKNEKNPIIIEINRDRQIIGYENKYLKKIGNNFLDYNIGLKRLNLPELEEIGDFFLYFNEELIEVNLPKVKKIGHCFLSNNSKKLKKLNLPKVKEIGGAFLDRNNSITEVNLPELKKVGNLFLQDANRLTKLDLPKLEEAGIGFLEYNNSLSEIYCPKLNGELPPNIQTKVVRFTSKNMAKLDYIKEITKTQLGKNKKRLKRIREKNQQNKEK